MGESALIPNRPTETQQRKLTVWLPEFFKMDRRKMIIADVKAFAQLESIVKHVRVHDGDLISKPDRDILVKHGLAVKSGAYNIATPRGVRFHDAMKSVIECAADLLVDSPSEI